MLYEVASGTAPQEMLTWASPAAAVTPAGAAGAGFTAGIALAREEGFDSPWLLAEVTT